MKAVMELMRSQMSRWTVGHIALLAALVALPSSATAEDTWTDVAPGIRQLVRTAPGPLRYVAVTIDISRPEVDIRVTKPGERAQQTSAWANQVGATVAINGDWSDGSNPVGLSVGDGEHWPGTADVGWSFMGCTLEKECVFDDHTVDTPRNPRWRDVVGGNGWRLLIDGNIPQYPNEAFYNSDRHPRSGVGLSADGNLMIFAVAEGRRANSIGVTFPEMAQFFKGLGAHQAMMLDGGGSSTLVLNGNRLNNLPSNQSTERVVGNHLGILIGTPDPRCSDVPNGKYCEGSVIHTCEGSAYRGQGDCGAFGASCEVTSDGVGTCVHPDCTGGANGKYCENATEITTCYYGQPAGTGDCAAFGATCETGPENAYCVHPDCTEGGNVTWCRDDGTVASCVDGQPVEDAACGDGTTCQEGACVDPDAPPTEDPNNPNNDDGSPGEPGTDDGNNNTNGEPPAGGSDDDGEERMDMSDAVVEADGSAGCATAAGSSTWLGLLMLLGFFRRRRR